MRLVRLGRTSRHCRLSRSLLPKTPVPVIIPPTIGCPVGDTESTFPGHNGEPGTAEIPVVARMKGK
jgi:hypothetical protein